MAAPTILQGVPEDSTYQITGTLKDEAGVVIPSATLDTVKMWLTDHLGATINSRSGTSILNAGPGTVHATSGLLTLVLVPADTPIVGSDVVERHRLVIEWVWDTTEKGHALIYLNHVNDIEVPTV